MNILLHICCAPCALYTVDKLRQDGHKVEGFFYNPNIAPLAEYKLRREAVQTMAKRLNLQVMYNDEAGRPSRPGSSQGRCVNCWRMRLSEVSKTAKQAEFDAFSTTLLISPYQNHEVLKQMGYSLAKEEKVDFYYDDFRIGFRKSQEMARAENYYRQKYCGCELSIREAQSLKRKAQN